MSRHLPTTSTLKKRAKALLRSARSGDADALRRIRAQSRAHTAMRDQDLMAAITLMQCQHVLAVEAGTTDWEDLRRQNADHAGILLRMGVRTDAPSGSDADQPHASPLTQYVDPPRFDIPMGELRGHLGLFGQTGSGKTNLLEVLLTQAIPASQATWFVMSPLYERRLDNYVRHAAPDAYRHVPVTTLPAGVALAGLVDSWLRQTPPTVLSITPTDDDGEVGSTGKYTARIWDLLAVILTQPMEHPVYVVVDAVDLHPPAGHPADRALADVLTGEGSNVHLIWSGQTGDGRLLQEFGIWIQMRAVHPPRTAEQFNDASQRHGAATMLTPAMLSELRVGACYVMHAGHVHRVQTPRDAIGGKQRPKTIVGVMALFPDSKDRLWAERAREQAVEMQQGLAPTDLAVFTKRVLAAYMRDPMAYEALAMHLHALGLT